DGDTVDTAAAVGLVSRDLTQIDGIVAGTGRGGVLAVAGIDHIVTGAGCDRIVTIIGVDDVHAGIGGDLVRRAVDRVDRVVLDILEGGSVGKGIGGGCGLEGEAAGQAVDDQPVIARAAVDL